MHYIDSLNTDEIIGAATASRFVSKLKAGGARVRTDMVDGGVCYSVTLPRKGKAPIVVRHVEPLSGDEVGRFGKRIKRFAKKTVKVAKKVAKSKVVKAIAKAGLAIAKQLPGPAGVAVTAAATGVQAVAKGVRAAKRAKKVAAAVRAQAQPTKKAAAKRAPVKGKTGKPAGKLVVIRGRKYQVIALGAA